MDEDKENQYVNLDCRGVIITIPKSMANIFPTIKASMDSFDCSKGYYLNQDANDVHKFLNLYKMSIYDELGVDKPKLQDVEINLCGEDKYYKREDKPSSRLPLYYCNIKYVSDNIKMWINQNYKYTFNISLEYGDNDSGYKNISNIYIKSKEMEYSEDLYIRTLQCKETWDISVDYKVTTQKEKCMFLKETIANWINKLIEENYS